MGEIQNVKVFACGEIPNTIVDGGEMITKQVENYVKVSEKSFLKYYTKGFFKKHENSKDSITLYEKHERSNLEQLKKTLDNSDTVIILGDLKDKHSLSNIVRISRIARKKGSLVLAMVLIPYSKEKSEQLKYDTEMQYLANKVDTFIPLLAEKIVFDAKKPLIGDDGIAFSESYMLLCLEYLIQFFIADGVLKIEQKDFNELFKHSGLGCISIGYGEGEDKTEKAIKGAFSNNKHVMKCNKLLVGISGGIDINVSYINNILKKIEATVCDDCNIIFEALSDEDLKDELIISIIGIENSGVHISRKRMQTEI